MYDELIKRLINRRICIQQSGSLDDFPLLAEAADAIEELSKPRWISVEERLPEVEEDVLIAVTVHTKKGDARVVTTDFFNTAGQWNGASCSWRYEVTHWMPLPQPPEEET